MARIRSVHPDLHRDKTLASASANAERTFVRLWCHLDDDGRGEDDPDLLKSDLYPRHRDMDAEAIERDIVELAELGLVVRYRVGDEDYLCCKPETWAKYQKPQKKKPSDLPGCDHPDAVTAPVRDSFDTPTIPLPPVGEGRGEGEEGSPPGDGKPFVARLADELREEHGCKFDKRDTLYQSFHELLSVALERLPEDRHRSTSMGVIAAFVERAQDMAMTKESRSHTARLVNTHSPLDVLHGYGEALAWGAGIGEDYANDPLSLSKYVAGVLSAKAKS